MTRYYPGSKVPFQTELRNNGVLTNAASMTFKWKIGIHGEEKSEAPLNPATGTYTVDVVPGRGGNLYARWDSNGEYDTVIEPIINIAATVFAV